MLKCKIDIKVTVDANCCYLRNKQRVLNERVKGFKF